MDCGVCEAETATRKCEVCQPYIYLCEQCDIKTHDVSLEDANKPDDSTLGLHPSQHPRLCLCEECEESISNVFCED
jgi:hypothetical protein